jgi:crotonobetainyl-CoA:carnitine CoA-transferase CaiB-like acyl-CoA transferase
MKLSGLRVVDLSVFLPGPYLTRIMADHGAEVLKVEAPGEGDPGRHIGLEDGPSTVFFRNLNRGKQSVVLDLKDPAQRDELLALADTADVFVEGFRPGVVDRLGVGYAAIAARNPRIVYVSISSFGQESRYRHRPAHDVAVESLAGVISLAGSRDGMPPIPALPVADLMSSMNALVGVLMALHRRHETGRGDYLDIAMADSVLAACANVLGPTLAENRAPNPWHERSTGGSAFYQIYATKDGRHVTLGGQEAKFVRNLLGPLGRDDLIALCDRGPGAHQQPVIDFLAAEFGRRTLSECLAWLEPLDLCYAPVNTMPEALADPNFAERGMVLHDALGRRHIGTAIRFHDEPARLDLHEPAHGEHTAAVRAALAAAQKTN